MSQQHEPCRFHGSPCLRLRNEGATAIVALHGAQVLSWIPADGRERLFLGARANFAPGSAIRGGIPVIFPQFAGRGALRKHGFARALDWAFAGVDGDETVFALDDGPGTSEWPFAFACRLKVSVRAMRLAVSLEVQNHDAAPFAFTAALHTYLRVGDIAHVSLQGLQGCDYEDSANGGTLHRASGHAIAFAGEVDRIYRDVVAPLVLADGVDRLQIGQRGFSDAIVWNPGEALAARIGDLAPGEYRRFVCVEAGKVLEPVALMPGERWCGSQVLG
ncbi:D-hexose-6-phosphate mutarotase [Luteimonas saliphila]|uniref:D-hexose-6-phosphate mutarotase n=1 Tax=Luteimonas saliphila TaxID=2804919 RepID=UPI00192E0E50|nr:D-hexose-6-phosphate mutarotase [Luteimonas saliphila]